VADRQPTIKMARIYEAPAHDDAYRVLVDRLWPRGVAKSEAALDEWAKDVAPSDQLRRWYAHDPAKFVDFRTRYRAELQHAPARPAVEHLRDLARERRVLLLTATKDVDRSGAAVLLEYLTRRRA
jgi:uncharacterized protein YeaO (DUF488 family)